MRVAGTQREAGRGRWVQGSQQHLRSTLPRPPVGALPHACSPPLLPAFPSLQAGWAMAEGVLSYRCNGSTTPLKLGVEGDGQYA